MANTSPGPHSQETLCSIALSPLSADPFSSPDSVVDVPCRLNPSRRDRLVARLRFRTTTIVRAGR